MWVLEESLFNWKLIVTFILQVFLNLIPKINLVRKSDNINDFTKALSEFIINFGYFFGTITLMATSNNLKKFVELLDENWIQSEFL